MQKNFEGPIKNLKVKPRYFHFYILPLRLDGEN